MEVIRGDVVGFASGREARDRGRAAGWALWLLLAGGCAPSAAPPEGPVERGGRASALLSDNGSSPSGLTTNGLTTNGLTTNGLTTNGLTTNGLTTNGLATHAFCDWFAREPQLAAMVMPYLVACAAPGGAMIQWVDPATGQAYAWSGELGLAPGWASGLPATEAEEQLVTGCLAAHANKYGLHLTLSVLGVTAGGTEVPVEQGELQTYSRREACFFGNLFDGEGVFAGNDRGTLRPAESSPRACGLVSQVPGLSIECPPILHVGDCAEDAGCSLDPTGTYYVSCVYNGKVYRPITTRIRPADVYTCGDGICQFTERCHIGPGVGVTYDSCSADCGQCP